MVSMTLKLLFFGFAVSISCDAHSEVQNVCQQVTTDDEMSMLQAMPPKRGVDSTLLAEAEAKAEDLTPAARDESVLHPDVSPQPLLLRLIDFYKSSLVTWPHLTNGIAAYLIATMGDASAQLMTGGFSVCSMRGFDVKRNIAQSLTTSMYNGVILTSWLLEINKALPGFDLRLVMLKLAATQTLLQPLVYVPFFFIVHGTFRGQSLGEIRARFRTDYFAFLFRLWSLFMPTRFLMFLIVPVNYQVLWDSTIAFIWQVALSFFNAARAKAEPAQMISAKTEDLLERKLFVTGSAKCETNH